MWRHGTRVLVQGGSRSTWDTWGSRDPFFRVSSDITISFRVEFDDHFIDICKNPFNPCQHLGDATLPLPQPPGSFPSCMLQLLRYRPYFLHSLLYNLPLASFLITACKWQVSRLLVVEPWPCYRGHVATHTRVTWGQIFKLTYRGQNAHVSMHIEARNAIVLSIFLFLRLQVIWKNVNITKNNFL